MELFNRSAATVAIGGHTVTATPATGPAITATGAASPIGLTGLASSTAYDVTMTSSGGGLYTPEPCFIGLSALAVCYESPRS